MTKSGYRSKDQWKLNGDAVEIITLLKAIQLPTFTPAEWNALTLANGMIGYDSTYEIYRLFNGVSQQIPPVDYAQTVLENLGATPPITALHDFIIRNAGAQTITDFTGEYEGQVIRIRFDDNNTTLAHGANIFLLNKANKNFLDNDVITLQCRTNIWYQMGGTV